MMTKLKSIGLLSVAGTLTVLSGYFVTKGVIDLTQSHDNLDPIHGAEAGIWDDSDDSSDDDSSDSDYGSEDDSYGGYYADDDDDGRRILFVY